MLAPAWLDHVALVAGVEPPDRRDGFAWCDLGCGQGVTAAILAATHPSGSSTASTRCRRISTTPAGWRRRRRFRMSVSTAVDFAAAIDLELAAIRLHCRAWRLYLDRSRERSAPCAGLSIGASNRAASSISATTRCRAGRAICRSSAWCASSAGPFAGDSAARFIAAADVARAWPSSASPALAASFTIAELKERPEDYLPAYLVHEFMPAAWQPLYVTEVRETMAAIGLEPVGSATLSENFDWMVLSEAARGMLLRSSPSDARELVRDFFLDQRFRSRRLRPGQPAARSGRTSRRLLSSTFALARPRPAIRYTTRLPAGAFSYDNPAARAIVDEAGRRSAPHQHGEAARRKRLRAF